MTDPIAPSSNRWRPKSTPHLKAARRTGMEQKPDSGLVGTRPLGLDGHIPSGKTLRLTLSLWEPLQWSSDKPEHSPWRKLQPPAVLP